MMQAYVKVSISDLLQKMELSRSLLRVGREGSDDKRSGAKLDELQILEGSGGNGDEPDSPLPALVLDADVELDEMRAALDVSLLSEPDAVSSDESAAASSGS